MEALFIPTLSFWENGNSWYGSLGQARFFIQPQEEGAQRDSGGDGLPPQSGGAGPAHRLAGPAGGSSEQSVKKSHRLGQVLIRK